jgi:hypothetical protein
MILPGYEFLQVSYKQYYPFAEFRKVLRKADDLYRKQINECTHPDDKKQHAKKSSKASGQAGTFHLVAQRI